jgi:hypothetical protein
VAHRLTGRDLFHIAPVLVDEAVELNAQQPRFEVRTALESFVKTQRTHERVLDEVFGIGG